VLLTVREPAAVRWLGRAQALIAAGCVAVSLSMQGVATGWCAGAFVAMFLALVGGLQAARVYRLQGARALLSGLIVQSSALQSDALQLAADASGRWALREPHDPVWHIVAPTRVWRGPGWVTLRLAAIATPVNTVSDSAAPDAASSDAASCFAPKRTWTLTLWRCALPADDWRKLSVLLRTAHQFAAAAATPA